MNLQLKLETKFLNVNPTNMKHFLLAIAAIFFGVSQLLRWSSGAKKIPPPIPTIPERNPIPPPKNEFLIVLKVFFSFTVETRRLETHMESAANNKVNPKRMKNSVLLMASFPPR